MLETLPDSPASTVDSKGSDTSQVAAAGTTSTKASTTDSKSSEGTNTAGSTTTGESAIKAGTA